MEPAINDFLTEHDEFSSQEADNAMAGLSQHTGLVLPRNRRMVLQYLTDETSSPALHLYYDDKEIFFDEPDLFPFGEALARQLASPRATRRAGAKVMNGPGSATCCRS